MRTLIACALALCAAAGCSGGTNAPDVTDTTDTSVASDAADGGIDAASDSADEGVAIDVTGEAAQDTWANYAQNFFATYCVSCHGPTTTDRNRDYSQLSQVQRDQMLILCGVTPTAIASCGSTGISPSQFPIGTGPHPTDDERNRIVAWIMSGAM